MSRQPTNGMPDGNTTQKAAAVVEDYLANWSSAWQYRKAWEVVPEMVLRESPVQQFLEREDGNAWRAATRLSNYWHTRKVLFGDRWLLPMTATGTGALRPSDVAILRSGFLHVVPDALSTGNHAYIADFTLLPTECLSHVQPEVAFYLASILRGDVTIIFLIRRGNRPMMMTNHLLQQIRESTLLRVKQILIAQVHEIGREHLLDFLGYQQQRYAETNLRIECRAYITGRSASETFTKLQGFGFDRASLPVALGGDRDQRHFTDWIRARLSLEDILSAVPPPSAQAGLVAMRRRPHENETAFVRRRNASHARKSYHRRKLRYMELQEQEATYQLENERLRREHDRLQRLWTEATVLAEKEGWQRS